MRICAWEATKGAPFYEQKELRCGAAQSVEDALLRMARVNGNFFTSGSTCEGQHHHDFVRIASVRELEGIGHFADLLKSQLLI